VNLGRRNALVSLLLLLPVGLQMVVPFEAQAGIDGTCGEGDLCLWMDANQQGCLWDNGVHEDYRKERYTTCPDRSMNDSVSSYRNDRGVDWLVMWENPNFKGAAYCVGPKASGNVQPGFNDKASSSTLLGNDQMTPENVRKLCKWVDTD
jgi:Peptidase inhibitor family I36